MIGEHFIMPTGHWQQLVKQEEEVVHHIWHIELEKHFFKHKAPSILRKEYPLFLQNMIRFMQEIISHMMRNSFSSRCMVL